MYKPHNNDRGWKGGGRSFGGGNRGFKRGGYGQSDREMHSAVCAGCGNSCQVPFRPNGVKPVYCSECFSKEEGGGDFAPKRFDRPSYGEKKPYVSTPRGVDTKKIEARLESIEEKLDALIEALTTDLEEEADA